jgi:hypothetical protein
MPLSSARISPFHVAVAAEAFAAARFARCGLDVSVQYGANQPEYDLVVGRNERMLKVSVKGSQDGGWGLTQSYMEKGKATYHAAADRWCARHKPKTILCFVQFQGVPLDGMRAVYLATPQEVAAVLKRAAKGRGDTILWVYQRWGSRAHGAGTEERIPDEWRFSSERIEVLLRTS